MRRLVLVGAVVVALIAPASQLAPAGAASWRYFVKVCRPLAPPTADETQVSQWIPQIISKTLAAYYRGLGWELHNVFVYRVYLHLPNVGSSNWGCSDILDGDADGIFGASTTVASTRIDNCWTVYNPGQEDADGDGIGDACE